MDSVISVTEAAKIKNVTRQAIYLAIKLKKLRAYKSGSQYKLFSKDLEKYEENLYSRTYHSTINGERIFNEDKGYISVGKASEIINVPKQKLYYAIQKGVLKAFRKKAAWVILLDDLMEYKHQISKNDLNEKSA